MKKLSLLLTFLLLFFGAGFSQTENTYMARVSGLNDSGTDLITKEFLLQQDGIIMSRIDHYSEIILIKFNSSQLNEAQLIALLEGQNIHVICSVLEENPVNLREKLQSKCFKTNSGIGETETLEK